jgi:hypothetical protein
MFETELVQIAVKVAANAIALTICVELCRIFQAKCNQTGASAEIRDDSVFLYSSMIE